MKGTSLPKKVCYRCESSSTSTVQASVPTEDSNAISDLQIPTVPTVQQSIPTEDSNAISDLQISSKSIGTPTVPTVQHSIRTEDSNAISDLQTSIGTPTVPTVQSIPTEDTNSISVLQTLSKSTESPKDLESNDTIDSNCIPKFFECGEMVDSVNLVRDFGENGIYEDDIALQISDTIICYGKLYRLSKDRVAIYYHNRKPCQYEYRYYGPIRILSYDVLVRRR